MADIKELHSCRETSWRSSSKYNSSEGYTYKGYRLIDWLIDWYNSGRYTYSQRVSSAGLTSVVITSPTSPVLSSLPVNHSKHDTNRPTMMMRSPCSRLSSSGPPASYSTVATQEPVARMGRERGGQERFIRILKSVQTLEFLHITLILWEKGTVKPLELGLSSGIQTEFFLPNWQGKSHAGLPLPTKMFSAHDLRNHL